MLKQWVLWFPFSATQLILPSLRCWFFAFQKDFWYEIKTLRMWRDGGEEGKFSQKKWKCFIVFLPFLSLWVSEKFIFNHLSPIMECKLRLNNQKENWLKCGAKGFSRLQKQHSSSLDLSIIRKCQSHPIARMLSYQVTKGVQASDFNALSLSIVSWFSGIPSACWYALLEL